MSQRPFVIVVIVKVASCSETIEEEDARWPELSFRSQYCLFEGVC